MIRHFFPSSRIARSAAACALALLALAALPLPQAQATVSYPAVVVPNDTYSLRVVGYNSSFPAQNIFLTDPSISPTFGTTTNYPNGALGGQTLTVSSSQSISNGFVTDLITLSVPSNFVPTGTRDNGGNILNAIQFSIGTYLAGTDPLNLAPGISSYTADGAVIFINNGALTTTAVPLTSTLTAGGTAFSAFGTVTSASPTADISANQVRGFSFTLTYPVPEPSTNAALALGVAGLLLVVVRRRRVRA